MPTDWTVQLNRIYGWLPDLYNKTHELPKAMPKDLKNHIESVAATNKQEVTSMINKSHRRPSMICRVPSYL